MQSATTCLTYLDSTFYLELQSGLDMLTCTLSILSGAEVVSFCHDSLIRFTKAISASIFSFVLLILAHMCLKTRMTMPLSPVRERRINFTSISGYFLQDDEATDPQSFSYVRSCLHLPLTWMLTRINREPQIWASSLT